MRDHRAVCAAEFGGESVWGHLNGADLGTYAPDEVSCSCSLGVHAIGGCTPAEVIRQVAWHTGWQGDPERLAVLATVHGDVRPALAALLASPRR
jgi:hypothetical protein